MRRVVVLAVLIIFTLQLTAPYLTKEAAATDAWASSYQDWLYRRPITITEQSGSNLTDFQVKITLDSSNFDFSKANSDGSDIRFADQNGNPLPYYIESWDSTNQKAVIWVKVPSIPASSSVTIYMYYGNSQAASESDGNKVFDFFDDFNGANGGGLDTSKWNLINTGLSYSIHDSILTMTDDASIGGIDDQSGIATATYKPSASVIIETKARGYSLSSSAPYGQVHWIVLEDDNTKPVQETSNEHFLFHDAAEGDIRHQSKSGGSWGSEDVIYSSFEENKWYIGQCVLSASSQDWRILDENGNVLGELINNADPPQNFAGNYYLSVQVRSGSIDVDWVRVRKYASSEPSVSVGAEEANTATTTYTVTLSLKDDSNNPLSGVTITVKNSNGSTVLSGTYNDGGNFSLVSTGDYTIEASKDGYVPASTTVSITNDTTSYSVSLTLTEIPSPSISYSPDTVHVGDTVTATASAPSKSNYTWSYEYRFEDSNGNVLQDWSTTNTYTVPSSLKHGTLVIKARTVDSGSGAHSLESSVSVSIANSPPTAPTLTTDPSDVGTAGQTTIKATASGSTDADGDSITYQYKFVDITDPNNPVVLHDWSTTNTYQTASSQQDHTIRVYARAYDGTDYSSEVYADVPLTNHPPSAPTNIETQYGQVIRAGVQNTLIASGSTDVDENDSVTYEFKIIDVTTGATVRDWSSTNTWTPSATSLYHEIRIYARAKDTHGAISDDYDEYFFVLPAKTINDVPFDPSAVSAKVEFNLTGSLSASILQNIFTADSNGTILWKYFDQDGYTIIEWAKIEGNKITIWSNNKFGPWIVPYFNYDDVGSPKWDKDFVNRLTTYAKDAGYATADAAVTGEQAWVVGITEPETLWGLGDKRYMTAILSNTYTFNHVWYNKTGLSIIPESWFEVYSWGDGPDRYRWIDWYDVGESAKTNSEDYIHWGGGTRVRLIKEDLASFKAWQENQSFNFYFREYGDCAYVKTSFRLLGIAKKGSPGESAVLGDSKLLFSETVYPMEAPRTIVFRFRDDAGNTIPLANVWINGQYLGLINDGQSHTVSYTGIYTITASAPHHYNATVSVDVEINNQEIYITLDRVSYNVTVKVTDQAGNPITASLYIDAVSYGTVNESKVVQVKYGSHTFKAIDSEGYSSETTATIDQDGQTVTVKVIHPVFVTFEIIDANTSQELKQVSLTIDAGDAIIIDSGYQTQIMPGRHTFNFAKDGYLATSMTMDVSSDTTVTVWLLPGNEVGNSVNWSFSVNWSDWNITPINPYAKAFMEANGSFGDTIKLAVLGDDAMKTILPQGLIFVIVIIILYQTESPLAAIGGALAMQAMWVAWFGEQPNLRNSGLTFILIVFLVAYTLWDLFYNYARET